MKVDTAFWNIRRKGPSTENTFGGKKNETNAQKSSRDSLKETRQSYLSNEPLDIKKHMAMIKRSNVLCIFWV